MIRCGQHRALAPASPRAGSNQSVLSPHGPGGRRSPRSRGSCLASAHCRRVIVGAAALLALRGTDRVRKVIAGHRAIVAGGIIFPIVVLAILLFVGLWLTAALSASAATDAIRIEVIGEQWWWRVPYSGTAAQPWKAPTKSVFPPAAPSFSELKSADVIHSFWIPSLGGKVDMIPGRTTACVWPPTKPGVYRGLCAEYCGGPHALMAFRSDRDAAGGLRCLARGKRRLRHRASTDDGRTGQGALSRGGLRRVATPSAARRPAARSGRI